jgi:hypothetical protein
MPAAGLLFMLLQVAGGAAPPGGSISGHITDKASGRPLPRIVVALYSADRAKQAETLTDKEGEYEFVGLKAGKYTVGSDNDDTGNRPNRICSGTLLNPTIDHWFDTSCFVATTDTTGTYGNSGRNILRGPGSFNIDASLIKNTKIGALNTEFRVEAFNVLNHPQFAQPNGTIGNAAVGTISAMLSSPSCSLCGATARQVQPGLKVRF